MPDAAKVLVRNARDQDIPAVAEIDAESFSPDGSAEGPELFQLRLTAFPNGFIILVADNEIAAYGCSEKWLTERDPDQDEPPASVHQPDGRVLCITGLAVKMAHRGRGYGLRVLDKLIETAHLEGCKRIIVETTDAQGLFLKRGFKAVRKRTEEGRSLDVMALEVKPTSMN